MFEKILVVCIGNICRSPLAAAMLQNALPEKIVNSAGLHALEGNDIEPTARRTAENHGETLQQHSATQLTSELVNDHDLILVMEQRHRDEIGRRYPEALAKTMLYGQWANLPNIPDPYRKSPEVFEQVYKMIKTATEAWTEKL